MRYINKCFAKSFLIAFVMVSLSFLAGTNNRTFADYVGGDVSNGGSISGVIKMVGDVPSAKMLNVDKDQGTCGHDAIPSEALIVSHGSELKNAVVSITNISKGKKFSEGKVAIDQKGCIFVPHVTLIPKGQSLDLLNSDDIMHNLHSYSMKNTAFNEGVTGGNALSRIFEYPETIKITCDVHTWMTSWLIVQDNPYYSTSNETGAYKIDNVPAGDYTLQVWHESLGKTTKQVSVKAGENSVVNFDLEMKAQGKKRRRR
ncbi:MAG: carboxypeptidase regulatory-like domain-containing protein [Candidatus Scalindua sp.]|nr:carboxypeptidase regulatory-like domain-containing protein [Candidatus Scalindua sp.]